MFFCWSLLLRLLLPSSPLRFLFAFQTVHAGFYKVASTVCRANFSLRLRGRFVWLLQGTSCFGASHNHLWGKNVVSQSCSMDVCSQGRSFRCLLHPAASIERLPSFGASFLNKISCGPPSYPSHIYRLSAMLLPPPPTRSPPAHHLACVPADTIIKSSFPLLQQGKTFKIQTAATLSVQVWCR